MLYVYGSKTSGTPRMHFQTCEYHATFEPSLCDVFCALHLFLLLLKKNLVSFFSARIAKQEDEEQLRLIEEEERREQERKRRKMARDR
jgi:hypothetical protein